MNAVESVVITETDWYQEALAVKLGPRFRKQHICDMERNRRSISKAVAKKLAVIFGMNPARFI